MLRPKETFSVFDLFAMEDVSARPAQITQVSTFTLASLETLCVHSTLGEINNIMEAAIFIHLIHYFVAKVTEVMILRESCLIVYTVAASCVRWGK